MSTTTMRHQVLLADGVTPVIGVDVRIEMPSEAITEEGAALGDPLWLVTDDQGWVSFPVRPNAELNPLGTHYELSTPYVQGSRPLPFTAPAGITPALVTDYLAEELPDPGPIVVGVSQEELSAALAALGTSIGSGQPRFAGIGPPPVTIVGAAPGDIYLDASNGDLYQDQ